MLKHTYTITMSDQIDIGINHMTVVPVNANPETLCRDESEKGEVENIEG